MSVLISHETPLSTETNEMKPIDTTFTSVLRTASTFECFECTSISSCRSTKMTALQKIVHKLSELSQLGHIDSNELKLLLLELENNKVCPKNSSLNNQPI